MNNEVAKLIVRDQTIELPLIIGSHDEIGIDISKLRKKTGLVTLDPGFKNTGSTTSAITFLNGEEGILHHRGYLIDELASQSTFLEVAYLVIYGSLPSKTQLIAFTAAIKNEMDLPPIVKSILDSFPATAHPMGMLTTLYASLSSAYPDSLDPHDEVARDRNIVRLIAKMPALAAAVYRKQKGLDYIEADPSLGYIENFLYMMTGEVNQVVASALNTLLILHADHEQNCSASTVRIVGSAHSNLYASVAAGNAALWGPLHGGANQKVVEMLEAIRQDGGDTSKYISKAKDKSDPFRLMGFGHRVYKNYDPRARIIKGYCDKILSELNLQDPVLDIAIGLESVALEDEYFAKRKLFPNVDFYSGIIYKALGIPVNMFTVMFAFGRLPGWIGQWKELRDNNQPIGRPRQIYTGHTLRPYTPMSER